MTVRIRALAVMGLMVTSLWVSGCGHFNCTRTFGASTCSSGGGITKTGGNGNSSTAAFAFAVDELGTIDGYTLTTGGTTPSFAATSGYAAPTVPTHSEGSGMVVAQKKYLYVAFPGTGQIFAYTIGSGGGLTTITGSPFSASFLVGAPSGGLFSMITNPAGTFLFMADTIGSIYVYQIGSSGALTQVSGSPFAVPFFIGNLGIDGLGKYLYATDNINPTEVAAYAIGSNGSLTAVPGSPFAYPMVQIQGDASGKFLIGVQQNTFGVMGVYVFSITQSGSSAGAITPVSGSPFPTRYVPISFAVQPNSSGTLIYTFSENATQTGYNPIEGFQLDTTSGALTVATGSPYSGISSGFWGQFDQSGTNLVVYGGVTNGTTVTTYLGALSVGSGGALTQPTSQLTLASSGYWAVTDPQ